MPEQKTNPATPSIAYKRHEPAVTLCRDVFDGTERLREKAQAYLPIFPKETEKSYERRVQASTLFNGLKTTAKGLTGMVFRKKPTLTDVQDDVEEHLEDVDLAGRSLSVFADAHFCDAWVEGHAGIFVDMESPEQPFASLEEEEAANLRPYWVAVKRADIVRWKAARVGGRMILSEVAWKETAVEKVGAFGEREVERVRGYMLDKVTPGDDPEGEPVLGVSWVIWRRMSEEERKKRRSDEEWEVEKEGTLWLDQAAGIPYPEIPLAVTYAGDRIRMMESRPPLEDLAHENVRHFRKQSDKDNLEHVTCVPILTMIGVDQDDGEAVSVGPTVGIKVGNHEATVQYTEVKGGGLQHLKSSLDDVERHIALLGLSMLFTESRAPETATSKRIDKSESDSRLASGARNLDAALNEALRYHAIWHSKDPEPEDYGSIEVNRDFENLPLDPQLLQALADMVPDKLSHETLWRIMQRGELLWEDFDPELEKELIEAGGEAALQRLAAMRRQDGDTGAEGDPTGTGDEGEDA